MSYQLNFVATFPVAGLTLNAKLYDAAASQVGVTITSGFVDHGDRSYSYLATIPNGHVGTFVVYDSTQPTTRAVRFSINPQEAENSASILSGVNSLIATIGAAGAGLTALPGMVWVNDVRTLSSGGIVQSGALTPPSAVLASAVAGATRPASAVTWMRDGATPEDLTGATLTGKIMDIYTGGVRSVEGTLTVTNGPLGRFAWNYHANDVATAGEYLVQFTATFPSSPSPARTLTERWIVYAAL